MVGLGWGGLGGSSAMCEVFEPNFVDFKKIIALPRFSKSMEE